MRGALPVVLVLLVALGGCDDAPEPAPADAAAVVPPPDAALPDAAGAGADLAAMAAEVSGAPEAPAAEAGGPPLVSLFNGRDLAGWVWVSAEPAAPREQVFSVVGGNLRCAGAPWGYLRTERQFTSFVLTLQLRHLKAGNGGVFLRVQGPDKIWPRAIEAQGQSGALGDIWNLDGFPMETDPARTTGGHTARLRPDAAERPLGEWNDYKITLAGELLTLEVNGVLQNEARKCAVLPGFIALQSEGAEYEFRDIVLRPLE